MPHYTKYNIILIEEALRIKEKKKWKKERGKLTLDQVL